MNDSHFVIIGSYNHIPILKKELVYFRDLLGNTYHNIILSETFYIPQLDANFVSLELF